MTVSRFVPLDDKRGAGISLSFASNELYVGMLFYFVSVLVGLCATHNRNASRFCCAFLTVSHASYVSLAQQLTETLLQTLLDLYFDALQLPTHRQAALFPGLTKILILRLYASAC